MVIGAAKKAQGNDDDEAQYDAAGKGLQLGAKGAPRTTRSTALVVGVRVIDCALHIAVVSGSHGSVFHPCRDPSRDPSPAVVEKKPQWSRTSRVQICTPADAVLRKERET